MRRVPGQRASPAAQRHLSRSRQTCPPGRSRLQRPERRVESVLLHLLLVLSPGDLSPPGWEPYQRAHF